MSRKVTTDEAALQNIIEADNEVTELKPEYFPKNGSYKNIDDKCKTIAFLRFLHSSWGKIAELLGEDRKTTYWFRLKYAKRLTKIQFEMFKDGEGLQHFCFALIREVDRGNVFAMKVYAHVTGLWQEKHEEKHSGSITVKLPSETGDWDKGTKKG